MKNFPMFLTMTDRQVAIIGGGEQAAQKTRLILKTEARIDVIADTLEPELDALAKARRIDFQPDRVPEGYFGKTALVFIATGCPGADAAWHARAKSEGALVNVVDQPDLCDAMTPSIVDRDPVVVAIGTEGTAPLLGRQIKTRIEELLEPRLGDLAALAGRLRTEVARRLPLRARRPFWRWVFGSEPRRLFAAGLERDAMRLIKNGIADASAYETTEGFVSFVGAGPGAQDLMTLRGVQRLQEADVIFYDDRIDSCVLELARRDAERVYTGKISGTSPWPSERIDALISTAAMKGKAVVKLEPCDPHAVQLSREIAVLKESGVTYEIVPGVSQPHENLQSASA
ncbi:MAG: NAD(P)-dependent oxidoreductase [Pseudomonadota bacterium]